MLALQDASPEVRLEAVDALGRLRADEAAPAIAPLAEAQDGADAARRSAAGRPQASGTARARCAWRRCARSAASAPRPPSKVLVAALAKDDPSAQRSPVRDALVAAGEARGGGARRGARRLALAEHRGGRGARPRRAPLDRGRRRAIIRAMQRGVVPLRDGLRALAQIGSSSALPTVLELLDDPDPTTRKEAIRAAAPLLDPARVDGRAVDPASAALARRRDAHRREDRARAPARPHRRAARAGGAAAARRARSRGAALAVHRGARHPSACGSRTVDAGARSRARRRVGRGAPHAAIALAHVAAPGRRRSCSIASRSPPSRTAARSGSRSPARSPAPTIPRSPRRCAPPSRPRPSRRATRCIEGPRPHARPRGRARARRARGRHRSTIAARSPRRSAATLRWKQRSGARRRRRIRGCARTPRGRSAPPERRRAVAALAAPRRRSRHRRRRQRRRRARARRRPATPTRRSPPARSAPRSTEPRLLRARQRPRGALARRRAAASRPSRAICVTRDPSEAVRLAAADSLARAHREGRRQSRRRPIARARCAASAKIATRAWRAAARALRRRRRPPPRRRHHRLRGPRRPRTPLPRAPFALVRADGAAAARPRRSARRASSSSRRPPGVIRLGVPAALAR